MTGPTGDQRATITDRANMTLPGAGTMEIHIAHTGQEHGGGLTLEPRTTPPAAGVNVFLDTGDHVEYRGQCTVTEYEGRVVALLYVDEHLRQRLEGLGLPDPNDLLISADVRFDIRAIRLKLPDPQP